MEMMLFVLVVRIGDWFLYLMVFKLFMKYFFVYDCINYVRMIFLYY